MRYVILRDDDTNAFTPVECLEQLYRPFLDRGLPVNLSVIPSVRIDAKTPGGRPEEFLWGNFQASRRAVPITENKKLVRYLLDNPGYCLAQHGLHHKPFEFDRAKAAGLRRRMEAGAALFVEAGMAAPQTFVAPHDRISRAGLREAARQFKVFSTGWFELRRLPIPWWPKYVLEKLCGHQHWRIGRMILLSHPGCLLSCHRSCDGMLDRLKQTIAGRKLTVLVTHWWEYFRGGRSDLPFIRVLHETARHLAEDPEVAVISFDALATGGVPVP